MKRDRTTPKDRDDAYDILNNPLHEAMDPEMEALMMRAAAMLHGSQEMGALPDPTGRMHRKIARAYLDCANAILRAEREYQAATKRPGFLRAERAYRAATRRAEVKR